MSSKDAEKQFVNRLGQCALSCPGSAVYSTVEGEFEIKFGDAVRQFGDKCRCDARVDGECRPSPEMETTGWGKESVLTCSSRGSAHFLKDTRKTALDW